MHERHPGLTAPTPAALSEGLRAALEPSTSARLRQLGPERARQFTPQAMGEAAWAAIREVA